MKLLLNLCLSLVIFCSGKLSLKDQEFREKINKEFTLSGQAGASTLLIYNISGSIRVEGYSGDKVVMEIEKTISADDTQTLELGKKEFKLGYEQRGDSILVFMEEPYDSRPNRNRQNWDNRRQVEYEVNLDFTVRIPNQMNLHASTVNHGDVVIRDVAGRLGAFNVNGPITLKNAKGPTKVHTINGNVEANYLSVPSELSSYYTLNGDIRVNYPGNLSADLQFKSKNGDFFTDFSNAEILPEQVVKNQQNKGGGTIYKLNKDTSVRIGNGGKTFKFETFNGNIYVKKQQ